jgi:hypothetical protein
MHSSAPARHRRLPLMAAFIPASWLHADGWRKLAGSGGDNAYAVLLPTVRCCCFTFVLQRDNRQELQAALSALRQYGALTAGFRSCSFPWNNWRRSRLDGGARIVAPSWEFPSAMNSIPAINDRRYFAAVAGISAGAPNAATNN